MLTLMAAAVPSVRAAPGEAHFPAPVAVAPGVWVFPGRTEEANPANRGAIANLGLIAGATGAVVVDTGASAAQGEFILAQARRLTGKPVVLAINTRATPERVLGNTAFRKRNIPILAQAEVKRQMDARCEGCLKNTLRLVGDGPLRGTRLVLPDRTLQGSQVISAGGRELEILEFGWSQSPGATAVLDRASGVLFAGDLVTLDRLPELRESRYKVWRGALDRLGRLDAQWLVPGRGPVSAPARLADTAAYLDALEANIHAAFQAGKSLLEAEQGADLPAYRGWALYDAFHRVNAHHLYLQIEKEDFGE